MVLRHAGKARATRKQEAFSCEKRQVRGGPVESGDGGEGRGRPKEDSRMRVEREPSEPCAGE